MQPQNERIILYQVFTRLFGNTNTTNRPWGTLEENGVGKFSDFTPKALSEIRDMGFTHIWYTGVIEHALLTDYTVNGIPLDDADVVKGRAGSPYAIKDYYDINPDLAQSVPDRMQEFEALVAQTQKAGLKVIIDFVPNHVARGYHSDARPGGVQDLGAGDQTDLAFSPHNNFYYLPGQPFQVPANYQSLGNESFPTKDGFFDENPAKATGNDVFSATPSVNDWFETIKLNYGVDYLNGHSPHFDPIPDTWIKMKEILLYWAGKNVDGFRCDMAEMVPAAFWQWAIREVKNQYPQLIFIAECYNPHSYREYLHTGGFDYLYDKVEMYDTLKAIIRHQSSTDALTGVWQRQDGIWPHLLRFLENHDEQRLCSPDFAGKMEKGIPLMAATAFLHTGPVMVYFGQEVGEPAQGHCGFSGDDGRTTIFDYWGVPEHVKWVNGGKFDGGLLSPQQKELRAAYRIILKACNEQEALREGLFYDLHYYNRNERYTGYSDQVYAVVRHTANQVLLIVINFSETPQTARIKIPEPAWHTFGITTEFARINTRSVRLSSTFDYQQESELQLQLKGLSYELHTLESV